MLDQLEQLKQEAVAQITAATDLVTLNDLRVKYLGKKRSNDRNHETNGQTISRRTSKSWRSG